MTSTPLSTADRILSSPMLSSSPRRRFASPSKAGLPMSLLWRLCVWAFCLSSTYISEVGMSFDRFAPLELAGDAASIGVNNSLFKVFIGTSSVAKLSSLIAGDPWDCAVPDARSGVIIKCSAVSSAGSSSCSPSIGIPATGAVSACSPWDLASLFDFSACIFASSAANAAVSSSSRRAASRSFLDLPSAVSFKQFSIRSRHCSV